MYNRYLAHISEDGGRIQTVREHLEGTAILAAAFAGKFGAAPFGTAAGLLHDVGKYADVFQKYIRGAGSRVDHATAGAQAARPFCPLLSFVIAGHHGGIPDGGSPNDTADSVTLFGRLKRDVGPCEAWKSEIALPSLGLADIPDGNFSAAFFTRMIYSCLVDADYLDTERFMSGCELQTGYASIQELRLRLDRYIELWRSPTSEIDRWRYAILEECMTCGSHSRRGLYTLTAPTGGGKTVSSLAFALQHAVTQKLDRVIYVIPYTSIIEQTVRIFAEILGEENVLACYSGMDPVTDGHDPLTNCRRTHAVDNWDAPVIVTTAVQFFESLYANRPRGAGNYIIL